VIWLQTEIVTSILQSEAATAWDNACAEAGIVAVDERARVAFAICNRKVNRIGATRGSTVNRIYRGALGIDQSPAFCRVLFGQECVEGRGADGRVSYEPARIGKGDPQRLDLQMQPFRRQWVESSQVERFQNVQR